MGSIPTGGGFSYFGFDDSKNSEKNPELGQALTQFGVFFRILSAAGFEE